MLPFLKSVASGEEYSTSSIYDLLSKHFQLSEEELNQYLPSGNQKVFYNRVFWAKAHLKMAGLIENTKRGYFKITKDGKAAIDQNPNLINLKYLRQFPTYLENIGKGKEQATIQNGNDIAIENEVETPEERLENSYLIINNSLSVEILNKVKSGTPAFFEQLVVELLVKMGYGGTISEAGKNIGKIGDEGIDGIIKEDRLGLDMIFIQAKKWEGTVGRPEIQKFLGALVAQGAKKGVFITTGKFSKEAREFNPKVDARLVLIDGEQLTKYMIDFNLGVNIHQTYEIKRLDNDYFEDQV
ncbi:restriction endonuclease [Flavihumibacter sediminis]|nr:restriction endonuclease [Flavihumibacter sediminis]